MRVQKIEEQRRWVPLSSVGKSAQIFLDLGISVGTVNVHLRTTRVKQREKNSLEAIYIAKQKGFI